MASLAIVNEKGAAAGEVTIDESWLEREKGDSAVHDTVVAYLATKRAGTAATKNRKLVRGGGAKPWRQKGTGRARAGSNRSPIWRGGGVIFGPQPRSFAKKVNKKVKKLVLSYEQHSKSESKRSLTCISIAPLQGKLVLKHWHA